MIEIVGDKTLYQWDTDREVRAQVTNDVTKYNVEFVTCEGGTVNGEIVSTDDNYVTAKIPNELLALTDPLQVYITLYTKNGERTTEEKSFTIKKRTKPTDYDANITFSSVLDEINGEVVSGGFADKLQYMKDCLEILYQSQPIKLMREVYGENKSLKELCEFLNEQQNCLINSAYNSELTYESSYTQTGFVFETKKNDSSRWK